MDKIDQNGDINAYNITCQNGSNVWSLSASKNKITIMGLIPYTSYQCSIAAINRIGQGPLLENCILITLEEGNEFDFKKNLMLLHLFYKSSQ